MFWQVLFIVYPLSVLGFRAAAYTYWFLISRQEGAPMPPWGDTFNESWFFTLGILFMIMFRPCE